MIKGCQKKMVVVRNIASDLFDEAYFIMKNDDRQLPYGRDEMMTEADRIVEASLLQCKREEAVLPDAAGLKTKKSASAKERLITFALGFAFGAAASALFFILK